MLKRLLVPSSGVHSFAHCEVAALATQKLTPLGRAKKRLRGDARAPIKDPGNSHHMELIHPKKGAHRHTLSHEKHVCYVETFGAQEAATTRRE